ncbi:MAG: hypothetical protein KA297_19420 [Kofleriaceae bacterium]|nr:hypothetical protein [Kofleriaceae bacterium]
MNVIAEEPGTQVEVDEVTRIWNPVDGIEIEIEVDDGGAGAAPMPRGRSHGGDFAAPAWVLAHAAIGPTLLGFTVDPGHCDLSDDALAAAIEPATSDLARGSSTHLLPVPVGADAGADPGADPGEPPASVRSTPAPTRNTGRPSSDRSTAAVLLAASASLGVVLALWTEVGWPARRRSPAPRPPAQAVVVDMRAAPSTPVATTCEPAPVPASTPARPRARAGRDPRGLEGDALFARRR